MNFFVHESSYVDEGAIVGEGTKIWHFCHILSGAIIGNKCSFGQNVSVAGGTKIGNNVKVQNNVSIYEGTVIEDDVFLGSQVLRKALYEKTLLRRGSSVGANATIVCGITIGRYAFIAAGAVVVKDVPDYALMAGVPALQKGWMSRHGHLLNDPDTAGIMTCPECGLRYQLAGEILHCLDLDEEAPLPEEMAVGKLLYDDIKDGKFSNQKGDNHND